MKMKNFGFILISLLKQVAKHFIFLVKISDLEF